jgi:uncharacterized protein (TIGR02611 family)
MAEIASAWRLVRRIVVTTVGCTLLCVGIVLLVIPGPGILLILAGLAVLATEYAWAHDLMQWIKRRAERLRDRTRPQAPEDTRLK